MHFELQRKKFQREGVSKKREGNTAKRTGELKAQEKIGKQNLFYFPKGRFLDIKKSLV